MQADRIGVRSSPLARRVFGAEHFSQPPGLPVINRLIIPRFLEETPRVSAPIEDTVASRADRNALSRDRRVKSYGVGEENFTVARGDKRLLPMTQLMRDFQVNGLCEPIDWPLKAWYNREVTLGRV